jgi:syntaxin 1B/2/3
MSLLVEQADEQLDTVEQNAVNVEQDMEKGNKQIDIAIIHVKNARKLRWCCFIIVVVILIIVAAVLAWYFTVGREAARKVGA